MWGSAGKLYGGACFPKFTLAAFISPAKTVAASHFYLKQQSTPHAETPGPTRDPRAALPPKPHSRVSLGRLRSPARSLATCATGNVSSALAAPAGATSGAAVGHRAQGLPTHGHLMIQEPPRFRWSVFLVHMGDR